jgi:hypothetical protein
MIQLVSLFGTFWTLGTNFGAHIEEKSTIKKHCGLQRNNHRDWLYSPLNIDSRRLMDFPAIQYNCPSFPPSLPMVHDLKVM